MEFKGFNEPAKQENEGAFNFKTLGENTNPGNGGAFNFKSLGENKNEDKKEEAFAFKGFETKIGGKSEGSGGKLEFPAFDNANKAEGGGGMFDFKI